MFDGFPRLTLHTFKETITACVCAVLTFFASLNLYASEVVWTENSQDYALSLHKQHQIDGIAWGLAWYQQQHLLISIRKGQILALTFDQQLDTITHVQEITGFEKVWARGQAGLLDIVQGPQPWYYLSYVKEVAGQGTTSLARFTLAKDDKGVITMAQWQPLFESDGSTNTTRHFGSRIAFDENNNLYMSTGDRGDRDNGQDLTNSAASILRLQLDGSVHEENPFADQKNANPYIYSYGHRNPQGIAFDEVYKRLWAIEHGPRGGDELNLIVKGANYGWPTTSHGQEYWGPVDVGDSQSAVGINDPYKVYIPSIAPGSLVSYQGETFQRWQGDLFSGALKLQHLNRIVMDEKGYPSGEERLLDGFGQRIRSLSVGPRGNIWIGSDSGGIYKLVINN